MATEITGAPAKAVQGAFAAALRRRHRRSTLPSDYANIASTAISARPSRRRPWAMPVSTTICWSTCTASLRWPARWTSGCGNSTAPGGRRSSCRARGTRRPRSAPASRSSGNGLHRALLPRSWRLSLVFGLTARDVMMAALARATDPDVRRPADARALRLGQAAHRHQLQPGLDPDPARDRHRLRRQAAADRSGRADLLRRGRRIEGRLSRGVQFRRHPQAAGDLLLREQPLRDLGPGGPADGDRHVADRAAVTVSPA